MRDTGGVCCTIFYGQDSRSPISAGTTHALYVAYAPAGISLVGRDPGMESKLP